MASPGMWKGTSREQIPWYPSVDLDKCAGCRKCYEFCSHGVHTWDEQTGAPKVSEPFQWVVGCSSCSQQCEEGAITFAPLTILKPLLGAS